ncbi:hypothetical protein GALL_520360 [mine drainage metagenome]|uniref:Peptidase M15C domain-containing protein n=1 Tax=mine drainage metagenome TaxID=410659 RepID=A0A1J5PM90_9ZZZZ
MTLVDTRKIPLDEDPCSPLTPLDCRSRRLDVLYQEWINGGRHGDEPVDKDGWTPEMKNAVQNFETRISARGFRVKITSAFRSPSYQLRLKEIQLKWRKYRKAKVVYDQECPSTIAELRRQFGIHGAPNVVADPTSKRVNPPHCSGNAVDINIFDKNGKVVANQSNKKGFDQFEKDWLAADLTHPMPISDPVHFQINRH